jgi:hypothetical protein
VDAPGAFSSSGGGDEDEDGEGKSLGEFEREFHVGGVVSSIISPGMNSAGVMSRCSMKDTWNELKIFPLVGSHRRCALALGAYLIRMQGTDR